MFSKLWFWELTLVGASLRAQYLCSEVQRGTVPLSHIFLIMASDTLTTHPNPLKYNLNLNGAILGDIC